MWDDVVVQPKNLYFKNQLSGKEKRRREEEKRRKGEKNKEESKEKEVVNRRTYCELSK